MLIYVILTYCHNYCDNDLTPIGCFLVPSDDSDEWTRPKKKKGGKTSKKAVKTKPEKVKPEPKPKAEKKQKASVKNGV